MNQYTKRLFPGWAMPPLRVLLCIGAVLLGGADGWAQSARFQVSADGQEVSDVRTALVWRRCPEGMSYAAGECSGAQALFTQDGALMRAQAEAARTGKAWRVPNIKELSSIADRSRVSPALDTALFPGPPVAEGALWSSTPYLVSLNWAMVMLVQQGEIAFQDRWSDGALRLVRSSQ